MLNACLRLMAPLRVVSALSLVVMILSMSPLWFVVRYIFYLRCNILPFLKILLPGTNGQDYPSRCHLERTACERRLLDLSVRYDIGKCNPCQGVECDNPHQECRVDMRGNLRSPICTCDRDCANETAPICASNGKTVMAPHSGAW